MNRRYILVLITDRANYGRLKPLMHLLNQDKGVDIGVLATGTTLLEKFGRCIDKIEEDGSKTRARVIDFGNKAVLHDEEGPALVNKEQRRKEYYLNGIEYDYDTWNEIMKGKEGLPWYKNPAFKGTVRF